ncbi:16.9 kDa class I heat shock protein 1-like [Cucurbita maxima]|uniref:16.9 kDa class I heat shock protein 1-like n=1 Tax=Cucurbita maxima TaxID=3661 RepID=A0A6J1IS17_CUCMA|nr:16.9 kDa class I heat shock protein 1-like [Cucurbita maxima]
MGFFAYSKNRTMNLPNWSRRFWNFLRINFEPKFKKGNENTRRPTKYLKIPRFLGGRGSNNSDPMSLSLDVWDPFDRETSAMANARIDWKETPEAHIFKADLPGMKKEEVKVEVEEGRVLQISGERSKEKEEKNDKWHRVERSSGKFVRRFRLPENAKVEEVKASIENGVLTVRVPKTKEKKPEIRSIEISG